MYKMDTSTESVAVARKAKDEAPKLRHEIQAISFKDEQRHPPQMSESQSRSIYRDRNPFWYPPSNFFPSALIQHGWKRRASRQALAPKKSHQSGGWADVNLGTRHIALRMPLPGAIYTKEQCLEVIEDTTVKGSGERGALIRFMVKHEFVPSKRAVYKLLNRDMKANPIQDWSIGTDSNWGLTHEENLQQWHIYQVNGGKEAMYEDDEFSSHLPSIGDCPLEEVTSYHGRKQKLIETFQRGDSGNVRVNMRGRMGWKGFIRFNVIPYEYGVENRLLGTVGEIKVPGSLIFVNICNWIGYEPDWNGSDILTGAFYFSPLVFPAPSDLDSGGSNSTFLKLKSYIELVSEQEESPVICKSGNTANHFKVFACRLNKPRDGKVCPFNFQVGWDKYGYFVRLHSSPKRSRNVGFPWHFCTP